jgi:hypothetical protein
MATEKQIAANRRNAQKSTGPTSVEGKAKARFNALKHGMTAEVAVLPHEDPDCYEDLRQSLIDDYEPANAGEAMLVEMVAINYWRLLRARRVESASLSLHVEAIKNRHEVSTDPTDQDDRGLAAAFANPTDSFRNLERYQATVERSYYRAMETLRKTQNDRKRHEAKIGSVPKHATEPKVRVAVAGASAYTTIEAAPLSIPMPQIVSRATQYQSAMSPQLL